MPEIIESQSVIERGTINVEPPGEMYKIKASIWLTGGSLFVGIAVLCFAAWRGSTDLQTWATGLISSIAGAAISYGFNSKKSG